MNVNSLFHRFAYRIPRVQSDISLQVFSSAYENHKCLSYLIVGERGYTLLCRYTENNTLIHSRDKETVFYAGPIWGMEGLSSSVIQTLAYKCSKLVAHIIRWHFNSSVSFMTSFLDHALYSPRSLKPRQEQ